MVDESSESFDMLTKGVSSDTGVMEVLNISAGHVATDEPDNGEH